MRFLILLLLVPFVQASSCFGGKQRLHEARKGAVRFETKTLQKKLGNCQSPKGACTQVDLIYPLLAEGPADLKRAINDTILAVLIQHFIFENPTATLTQQALERMAENFLLEWQAEKSQHGTHEDFPGWEVTVTGEVGLQTGKVAVVSLGTYSYAGGAHPNSYITIFNFDLRNGSALRWEDIVSDTDAVKRLAERAFKAARNLPPNADLLEEGYFWGEEFELPQNFELLEEGIYFWYNPYEVAAWSQGPTDFLLTYRELGGVIKKDVIF